MLSELRIENLGVIAEADLLLGPGLTVLTGETGAGKTMLVTAIDWLMGGRAESTMVRPGAVEARVEGRFVTGDDERVIERVVPAEGRSRAYIDGRLATVTSLVDVGAGLLDLHGQHGHQHLLTTATQRAALDRFGGVDLTTLRDARGRQAAIEAELATLGGDGRARARQLDLVRFQLDELIAARLSSPDEDETLDAEEDLLAGAAAHREAALSALAMLTDDGGALDAVSTAVAAIGHRAPFIALEERLRNTLAELGDIGAELRTGSERIEEDPARLDEVRHRRHLLRELRRKYGETLGEVMAFRDDLGAQLEELESYEGRVAVLEVERVAAADAVERAAAAVGSARRGAAPALAAAVEAHLHDLAMGRARLEVRVGDVDPGDEVTFLLGANAGEPALPLAKVASGGELARTMLALRLVLMGAGRAERDDPVDDVDTVDTVVFDEVDAGMGGEAALTVGQALSALGDRHQVLAVTHLAQVAAFADAQIAVVKEEHAGRTIARAAVVTGDERVRELSRMLSGLSESGSARTHAEDLLVAAERRRGR
ncbi:MAG: repair protein RecN [Acidimicrobiaceae bacterium]|nr:repair protein RecN [Acidimicrobiaceae bacterium]